MKNFRLALIIDDGEVDTFVVATLLQRISFAEEVKTASSALKALEMLDSLKRELETGGRSPEEICIFLDIKMPIMDGRGFLVALNKISPALLQRVYILSSLPLETQQEETRGFALAGYVSKPLREAAALQLLEETEKEV